MNHWTQAAVQMTHAGFLLDHAIIDNDQELGDA